MRFPGFLGNEPVKNALGAAFSAGRFPHAVILQGEPGTGKSTFARLLAQALVCRQPDSAPCGQCPGCIRAQAGSHPDIHIVRNGNSDGDKPLKIEAIQRLAQDIYRMPMEADHSVYILETIEPALPDAQTKLLKLMEEPPAGAMFLLVCRTAQNLAGTIRSRSQTFTLTPPPEEEAAQWLAHHRGTHLDTARELAALCGGNLGHMQALLDKDNSIGQAFQISIQLADAMLVSGGHPLMAAAAPLLSKAELFREVLARMEAMFRDACRLRSGGAGLAGGAPEPARRLSSLPLSRLVRLAGKMEGYRQGLDRNGNLQLLVTCFCADLRLG